MKIIITENDGTLCSTWEVDEWLVSGRLTQPSWTMLRSEIEQEVRNGMDREEGEK